MTIPFTDEQIMSVIMATTPRERMNTLLDMLEGHFGVEVPEEVQETIAPVEYHAQRIARDILTRHYGDEFAWVGNLLPAQVAQMSAHVGNYATKAEKDGRVVRIRRIEGQESSIYMYEMEFFKEAVRQYHSFLYSRLGFNTDA